MYVSSRDVKQANLNTTREAKGKQTHTPSPPPSLSLSILMREGWSWTSCAGLLSCKRWACPAGEEKHVEIFKDMK